MGDPGTPRRKNIIKGASYTFAIAQMHRAHKNGYVLEAIAIAESIINDRICSVVHGRRPDYLRNPERSTLGHLLMGWQPVDRDESILKGRVERWVKLRNKALHGICKSVPGHPTEPVDKFKEHSRKCAADGISLANDVLSWYRRSLRTHLKKLAVEPYLRGKLSR